MADPAGPHEFGGLLSPRTRFVRLYTQMPDWLWLFLILLAYVALMKWVLPRLGVPT